jgi:hypothetical protein
MEKPFLGHWASPISRVPFITMFRQASREKARNAVLHDIPRKAAGNTVAGQLDVAVQQAQRRYEEMATMKRTTAELNWLRISGKTACPMILFEG